MTDRHAWLRTAYIGPNPAHQVFRRELAIAKTFVLVLSKNVPDWLNSFGDYVKASAQEPGGVGTVGLVTRVEHDKNRIQGIFLTPNESCLATDDPTGFQTELHGRLYCDLHRLLVTYLMDVYGEIARKQPKILMSRKNLTFEEVVEAHERNDLLELIVEKQQTALSHMDRDELSREFDGLGLTLLVQEGEPNDQFEETTRVFTELWPLRNILEHNRGIVNRLFLKKHPTSTRKLGEKVQISLTDLGSAVACVQHVAESVNCRAVTKFALS